MRPVLNCTHSTNYFLFRLLTFILTLAVKLTLWTEIEGFWGRFINFAKVECRRKQSVASTEASIFGCYPSCWKKRETYSPDKYRRNFIWCSGEMTLLPTSVLQNRSPNFYIKRLFITEEKQFGSVWLILSSRNTVHLNETMKTWTHHDSAIF